LQLAGPILLLILTRWKIPVSTSFLLITLFVQKKATLVAIIIKSLTGYGIAFGASFLLFGIFARTFKK